MNIINDNKTDRFIVLFSLYIAANADPEYAINIEMLAQNRSIGRTEMKKIFKYLVEEKFIEPHDGGVEFLATITHKGLRVVEEVFLDNQKQTYYFPPYKEMKNKGQ